MGFDEYSTLYLSLPREYVLEKWVLFSTFSTSPYTKLTIDSSTIIMICLFKIVMIGSFVYLFIIIIFNYLNPLATKPKAHPYFFPTKTAIFPL